MQKTLPAFNKDLQEYGIDPVDIGIGLNLGPAMFSMIGEEQRLEGHVISDDVNLAAPLESLNKIYKTKFLITGAVYDRIADPSQYQVCMVDKVIVQGKSHPVKIYEIWPLPEGDTLEVARRYIAFFNEAFAAYEKGDFVKAEAVFRLCLEQWPNDQVALRLINRCIEFQKTDAPAGWDGTFKLTEK